MDVATHDPMSPVEGTAFSDQEMRVIITIERIGASLSVAGSILVFIAYALSKRLRTVPNTFIVFASVANLGASIACLIGDSGMTAQQSRLCQAQAFMFELFMQSDPWWSLAMAVNVYMVFFFSANPKRFLNYWWAYCLICYGIPLIPAMWLLLLRAGDGGRVYGDATIWCWIASDWKSLRILTYYLPIWVCIALSICIYFAVGCYVFRLRNNLRNLSLSNPSHDATIRERDSGEKDLSTREAVMGSINTEVIQVTTMTTQNTPMVTPGTSSMSTRIDWFEGPPDDVEYGRDNIPRSSSSPINTPYQTVTRITADPAPQQQQPRRSSLSGRIRRGFCQWRARFGRMDPVKLAYLRTSFVFAISVLVTWTPSSINRVHDVWHPISDGHRPSFGLNLASAVVLPLQGVWNAVIFFSTSTNALRDEFRARIDAFRGLPRGHQAASAVRCERERALELERRNANNTCNRIGNRSESSDSGNIHGVGGVSHDDDNDTAHKSREDSVGSNLAPSTVGLDNTNTNSTMRVVKGGSLTEL